MLKYYFWTSEIKLILLAGVCYGLSELHIAEAQEIPLPADSWDNSSSMGKHPINIAEDKEFPLPAYSWDNSSSVGKHPINIAEAKEFPLPADSWDSSMGNHSIIASTASELPTTESTTLTGGNTTAPTMPKGETSSGINIKWGYQLTLPSIYLDFFNDIFINLLFRPPKWAKLVFTYLVLG